MSSEPTTEILAEPLALDTAAAKPKSLTDLAAAAPADIRDLAWWSAGDRLIEQQRRSALAGLMPRIASVLAESLALPVTCQARRCAVRRAPSEPVFGLVLTLGGDEIVVGIDQDLARVIVDRQGERFAGLRGAGELTEVELGMLDYAVLDVLDRLAASSFLAPACVLSGFASAEDLRRVDAESLTRAVRLSVTVGTRQGGARVWIPKEWTLERPAIAVDADGPCRLRLVLPPLEIGAEAIAGLDAGDVVLLDASSVAALMPALRAVTTTGWDLGAPLSLDDTPTHAELRLETIAPRAWTRKADPDELAGWFGEVEIGAGELAALRVGGPLSLAKELDGCVRLLAADGRPMRAEFVRLQRSGLGLRLLECGSSP